MSANDWSYFPASHDDEHATKIQGERIAMFQEQGYGMKAGWDSRAPFDPCHRHDFMDHLYRLYTPGGDKLYVSEPYHLLGPDALTDLDGWSLTVTTAYALWYPGYTFAMTFSRKPQPWFGTAQAHVQGMAARIGDELVKITEADRQALCDVSTALEQLAGEPVLVARLDELAGRPPEGVRPYLESACEGATA